MFNKGSLIVKAEYSRSMPATTIYTASRHTEIIRVVLPGDGVRNLFHKIGDFSVPILTFDGDAREWNAQFEGGGFPLQVGNEIQFSSVGSTKATIAIYAVVADTVGVL